VKSLPFWDLDEILDPLEPYDSPEGRMQYDAVTDVSNFQKVTADNEGCAPTHAANCRQQNH